MAADAGTGVPQQFESTSVDPQTNSFDLPLTSGLQHLFNGTSPEEYELQLLKARLRLAVQGSEPAIYVRKHPRDSETMAGMGIRVLDWSNLKKHRTGTPRHTQSNLLSRVVVRRNAELRAQTGPASSHGGGGGNGGGGGGGGGAVPKLSRAIKSKSNGSGRTYTSKFRGVHQTFPTKRWEAQFRRNGKPTSLGCFDHEEEAARAYDKMMLWCELHNTAGIKGGITNFDPSEHEKDIPWLQSVTQDELIESLRSDGRRQAAHRMLRHKRDGPNDDDESSDGGRME